MMNTAPTEPLARCGVCGSAEFFVSPVLGTVWCSRCHPLRPKLAAVPSLEDVPLEEMPPLDEIPVLGTPADLPWVKACYRMFDELVLIGLPKAEPKETLAALVQLAVGVGHERWLRALGLLVGNEMQPFPQWARQMVIRSKMAEGS